MKVGSTGPPAKIGRSAPSRPSSSRRWRPALGRLRRYARRATRQGREPVPGRERTSRRLTDDIPPDLRHPDRQTLTPWHVRRFPSPIHSGAATARIADLRLAGPAGWCGTAVFDHTHDLSDPAALGSSSTYYRRGGRTIWASVRCRSGSIDDRSGRGCSHQAIVSLSTSRRARIWEVAPRGRAESATTSAGLYEASGGQNIVPPDPNVHLRYSDTVRPSRAVMCASRGRSSCRPGLTFGSSSVEPLADRPDR